MYNKWLLAGSVIVLVILSACNSNPLDIDVSTINVNMPIQRMEQALFAVKNQTQVDDLYKNYPLDFVEEYLYSLQTPEALDTTRLATINTYLRDTVTQKLYQDIQKEFTNISSTQKEIEQAFQHIKYYYPTVYLPRVVSYLSNLQGNTISDSVIAIGLDSYLGKNYYMYPLAGFYDYQTTKMFPQQIPYHVVYSWAKLNFEAPRNKYNALEAMVYEGKILYFMDAVFPDKEDSLKISYTGNQLQWCKNTENDIWSYLIEKKLLYEENPLIINNLLADGPHTKYFATAASTQDEAPARVGAWIGWQIIKSYMQKNKSITLQTLLQDTNLQAIFENSKYKPAK